MITDQATILRIAAFTDGDSGGNPAGIVLADQHPPEDEMRRIAADVGYSETAFACPAGKAWRVRYFSPESEVPFCGHATIALGAALAAKAGDGSFQLILNETEITVEGRIEGNRMTAALQSPPTHSTTIAEDTVEEVLDCFGYSLSDLDRSIPPARVHGGADHFALALNSRNTLSHMQYSLNRGRELMNTHNLVTVLFAWAETPRRFHARNPFASGGVYEDPATGAAAAAFAGYLRDLDWPHQGTIEIIQGEDMGMRSRLLADIPDSPGSSIRISGNARYIEEPER